MMQSIEKHDTIISATMDDWYLSMMEEVRHVYRKGQAILIICRDINTAQDIYEKLQVEEELESDFLIPYWRNDIQKLPSEVSFSFYIMFKFESFVIMGHDATRLCSAQRWAMPYRAITHSKQNKNNFSKTGQNPCVFITFLAIILIRLGT